jgi:glucose/arabinose dehydrogenase
MRTRLGVATALAASTLLAGGPALAQGSVQETLDKLQDFKITDAPEPTMVPQDTERADNIRKTLERIELPDGFEIDLYAVVPDARHMAVGPNAGVVFVGTRKENVWTVTDRDKNRVADEVKQFAPGIPFKFPNGVTFDDQGILYVAGHNRLWAFPAAEFFYEGKDPAVGIVKDKFFPRDEEYFNHAFRVIDHGPDGKLYMSIGQPYNVPAQDQWPMEPKGTIVRLNTDGSGWEVYARGIRNSVGVDHHPDSGNLWFTDNQVDGMGPDIPPGELNKATAAGQHFGFPWYGGGDTRTGPWKDSEPPEDAKFPELTFQAHTANLGLTFYTGDQFPDSYKNDLFVAQHGSWNRKEPVGARVMHVKVDEEGNVVSKQPFAEGWLTENDEYLGRPVDVAQLPDGSLLVSDDFTGAIYRIHYDG